MVAKLQTNYLKSAKKSPEIENSIDSIEIVAKVISKKDKSLRDDDNL
jgi:hypothetical protein